MRTGAGTVAARRAPAGRHCGNGGFGYREARRKWPLGWWRSGQHSWTQHSNVKRHRELERRERDEHELRAWHALCVVCGMCGVL